MSMIITLLTVLLYISNFLSLIRDIWLKVLGIAILTITVMLCFRSIKKFKPVSLFVLGVVAMAQINLITLLF